VLYAFNSMVLTCRTNYGVEAAKQAQYHQQPALTELPVLPKENHTSSNLDVDFYANSLHDSRHSDPFISTKPLDFDPDALLPSPTTNEPKEEEVELARSTTNDTIRTYRHVRPSPSGSTHRQALVPISLGPVVLSDAPEVVPNQPLPGAVWEDTKIKRQHQRSESTQELLSNAARQPYLENRETPYQRCGRQSTETLAMQSITRENLVPKASASTPSLSSSIGHHARDTSNSSSLLTLNERPRTGIRLQRKRSNQSKSSFGNPGDSDVEKEVLELNTIVEERRAESNKVRHGDSHHIPAVAPSMHVGARSETLNDIGSALSRPLTVHHLNSDEPAQELDSKQIRPKSSRVSGWLSSVTTSSATTLKPSDSDSSGEQPFYKCGTDTDAPRDRNNLSASSSGTALDSVLYTLESSPTTSKRYSRSLMITPLTPLDDGDGERRVGIAL
jgi:hypothetical protein